MLGGGLLALALAQAAHADAIYVLTSTVVPEDAVRRTRSALWIFRTVNSTTVSLNNNNKFLTTASQTGFSFNVRRRDYSRHTSERLDRRRYQHNATWFRHLHQWHRLFAGKLQQSQRVCWQQSMGWHSCLDVSHGSGLSLPDFVANSSGIFLATDILPGTTGNTGLVASDSMQVTTLGIGPACPLGCRTAIARIRNA